MVKSFTSRKKAILMLVHVLHRIVRASHKYDWFLSSFPVFMTSFFQSTQTLIYRQSSTIRFSVFLISQKGKFEMEIRTIFPAFLIMSANPFYSIRSRKEI